MIRIAVIDDEKYICRIIKDFLLQYQFKHNIDFEIDTFLSCEEMLGSLLSFAHYDLIFLDIEFPDMNGLELGVKIREKLMNIQTQIIFISSRESYAIKLFDVQPFDFLVKPVNEQNLYPCLSKYLRHYFYTQKFFNYTSENTKHAISINSILYIKSEKKKLRLVTAKEEITCYYKFSDAIEKDMKGIMLVIRRGLAVNINHIESSDYESVTMVNGAFFKISENYRNNIMEALSDRIIGGGVNN